MPLSDFVRYLNAQLPLPSSALRSTTPFVSEGGRVFVYFGNLRLDSEFSPIVDTAGGVLRGHVAQLNATDKTNSHPFESDAVFNLPSDDKELVFLDRLVRTLHTLNYLIYRDRHSEGLLLLKVHPRHVASVATDHGLAFEEILRACGLLPEQITLELDIDGAADTSHLAWAITNYKSRGYSIALGRIGRNTIDFNLLRAIQPNFIKFYAPLLTAADPIRPVIDRLHELGAKAILEGFNTATLRDDARDSGFDLLQVDAPPLNLRRIPAVTLPDFPVRDQAG